jgi:hypothetical protein
MEPPPYDILFVHLICDSIIHQFFWKKYFDSIGMKYYAIGYFWKYSIDMSKSELAWQLQDNAVQRFYLTLDLGFWRMTIVRIEDNVLKSKWFEKITC